MTTTEEREVPYAVRRRFEEASIPWELRWGSPAQYLAAWSEARRLGKPMTVGAACGTAGFSGDALRQRRKHNASFRAAERWARFGEPYVAPSEETGEPQDVAPADPVVTDTTWPHRPERPKPEIDHPLATGPTNTTLPYPPKRVKLKPTRRYTPMWVGGSGYEDIDR